jgi:hypothetical protein
MINQSSLANEAASITDKAMQNPIQSISDFLQEGRFSYHVFDLGRRVQVIPNELFLEIEQQKQPYPYPLQQAGWLAVVFYPADDKAASVIWFLKLPLDELGFLKIEARDGFLRQVLEHLGENIKAQHQGEAGTDALKESPFAFKPKQERLAMFHAILTRTLGEQPSQYYAHTRDYMQGDIGFEQWAFLGIQGIADFIARLEDEGNEVMLASAIPSLPDTPLLMIAELLENVQPRSALANALLARLEQALSHQESVGITAALIRALSQAQKEEVRIEAWQTVLDSDAGTQIDVLAALSGRAWKDLQQTDLLNLYMENAAQGEQAHFNALLADLLAIPGMREPVMQIIRSPERSPELSESIGAFMQALRA